jgi:hypothetical protein
VPQAHEHVRQPKSLDCEEHDQVGSPVEYQRNFWRIASTQPSACCQGMRPASRHAGQYMLEADRNQPRQASPYSHWDVNARAEVALRERELPMMTCGLLQ